MKVGDLIRPIYENDFPDYGPGLILEIDGGYGTIQFVYSELPKMVYLFNFEVVNEGR